jgi:hypothetical protein
MGKLKETNNWQAVLKCDYVEAMHNMPTVHTKELQVYCTKSMYYIALYILAYNHNK